MIFYSASLNLEDWLQALDRNHRIGQTSKTHVITLQCRESIDGQVYKLLDSKQDVRDLLQSNNTCKNCYKSIECFSKMIAPFSKKCIFYEKRKKAETVEKFNLRKTL